MAINLDRVATSLKRTIAIMTRGEGDYLHDTCESYHENDPRADILVADSGCGEARVAKWPAYVQHFHTGDETGTGMARHLLSAKATGDVVAYSDAHMHIASGYMSRAMAVAWWYQAIVVPLCGALEPLAPNVREGQKTAPPARLWRRPGGKLVIANKHDETPMICIQWNPPIDDNTPEIIPITGLIGGCYIVPTTVLKRVGGWCATRGWGYNDHSMSIAAFLAGVPILGYRGCAVLHKFGRRDTDRHLRPERKADAAWWLNAAWVIRALFADTTYQDIFEPIFHSRPNWKHIQTWAAGSDCEAHRERFASLKIRNDQEFRDHILEGQWPKHKAEDKPCVQPQDLRLLYNDCYFKINARSKNWHEAMAAGIVEVLQPESVFDVGCGTAGIVNWLVEHGIATGALDWSEEAKSYVRPEVGFAVADFADATLELNHPYDVLVLTDVLEHIPETRLAAVQANLQRFRCPWLIFGASMANGPGHVTRWPWERWKEWLREAGYTEDTDRTRALGLFVRQRRVPGTWRGTAIYVLTQAP